MLMLAALAWYPLAPHMSCFLAYVLTDRCDTLKDSSSSNLLSSNLLTLEVLPRLVEALGQRELPPLRPPSQGVVGFS